MESYIIEFPDMLFVRFQLTFLRTKLSGTLFTVNFQLSTTDSNDYSKIYKLRKAEINNMYSSRASNTIF
jgi:hypothetical protein